MAAAEAARSPPTGAAPQAWEAPPMAAAAARSAPTGAAQQAPESPPMATDPPPWLPAGMDAASSFLLKIKIVGSQFREGISGYRFNMVIDSDTTNYKDFVLRGPPKKRRKKKSTIQDPDTAMVVACASTTAPIMVYPSSSGLVSQINEDAGPSSSLVRSIKGSKEPKHASGEQKGKSKKSAPRKGKGKAAKEKIASQVVAIGEQTPKGKEKCAEVALHDSPAMGTRSKRASHSPAMSTRSKRAPVRLDL